MSSKQRSRKPNKNFNLPLLAFFIPSFAGISIFFFIPAALSLAYAFTAAQGGFVWFANFTDVLTNIAFRLAARNSMLFIAISVPLNMVFAFFLASLLQKLRHKKAFTVAFMLPLIIPSGSVVFFWNVLFADNGAINSILFQRGLATISWFSSGWSFVIILMVFLFRTIGFNLVLFLAGFSLIPKGYYEVAHMEGAGILRTFRHVTFIYIMPTTFLVFMMSIINSFRIFREIYLIFGPYPNQSVYMLQHFMNNQFLFANMQRLSVTATIIAAAVIVLVWGIFSGQKKISDTFS